VDADATSLPLIDGRFRLLRLLAIGGMGELYLATARDPEIEGLEQLVVLKRILPEYAADPNVVTMFLIEARIAARLDHPNVVRVYDMGKADGSIYFTMEYLHGADLNRLFEAARRSREGLPLGHVLTIALDICAGLHFAHEMRRVDGRPMEIVHRDVSPSNVFVTFGGEIKLLDFGIAKVISSTQITMDGVRKGKMAYMSPEQVKGERVDRRSDIYAIGILLYELVTLTHLFDGDNEYAILEQIAGGQFPPPSQRKPDILPGLERIILKALATSAHDRYPTAEDLAEDLERFAAQQQVAVSRVELRAYLKRMIGDIEYPWYDDEPTPEEEEAVRHWYAGARPEEADAEVEDHEISMTDMLEVELEEVFEPEAEPLPDELTRMHPRPLPLCPPPQQPQRPPPRERVPLPILFGIGTAAVALLSALLIRACRESPPPPDPQPPQPVAESPPPRPPPPPPKLAPPPVVEVPVVEPEPPAEPEPPKKKKKATKKKRD
jgi:hypothetical protein